MTEQTHPIAVIGAGIVGVSTALMLARDGHDVVLFDPGAPGRECSYGNASLIANFAVEPLVLPSDIPLIPGQVLDPYSALFLNWSYFPTALPWLLRLVRNATPKRVATLAAAKAALTQRIGGSLKTLLREAGAERLVPQSGVLNVYGSDRAWKEARAVIALRRHHGVRIEDISIEYARRMEPALAPVFKHATFYPDAWHVLDPLGLTEAFLSAFRARGGHFRNEGVLDFVHGEAGVEAVITESGTHPVRAAVVCAGAWSKALAARLGLHLPLEVERGYHLMMTGSAQPLNRPVCWVDGPIYMAPLVTGLRVTSIVEIAGMKVPQNPKCFDVIRHHLAKILPDAGEVTSEWMGMRPSFPDPNPVLGSVPGLKNMYFNFGHGHTGLTLAAPSAQIIADLIAGRHPGVDLTPYRADRF